MIVLKSELFDALVEGLRLVIADRISNIETQINVVNQSKRTFVTLLDGSQVDKRLWIEEQKKELSVWIKTLTNLK